MNKALSNELSIESPQIKSGALVYRAINHKLRQQMIKFLHLHKRVRVTELYLKMGLEQSVASQHLAILRKAGFVLTERDRKFIYYSVNYQRLKEVQENSEELLK